MAFFKQAANIIGGVLGSGLFGLFGKKKKQPLLPKPATRDDAAAEAAREKALAKRKGASADRIDGASGEPVGGFGNLIPGS